MNLSKSFEFFDPALLKNELIHIIGCGSVGSVVAELLARFGITKFVLYDFDYVEPHNLVNQMFFNRHVGMEKTKALKEIILDINPEAEVSLVSGGWDNDPLDGYVFLCVDNIELRVKIVKANMYNSEVKAMFDFRTGLTSADHFAADWNDVAARKNFLQTMNFSHEEAMQNTPVSACNVALCVAPTVRIVCNAGVTNFINFVKGGHLYKMIPTDAFKFTMEPVG